MVEEKWGLEERLEKTWFEMKLMDDCSLYNCTIIIIFALYHHKHLSIVRPKQL